MSTASNKASRELILKSFMSSESRKFKKQKKSKNRSKGKQRDTLINHDNLDIIKEESKKVKR